MPRNKDLKRLVRSRMQKTGESYTTARSRLLTKRNISKTAAEATAAESSAVPEAPGTAAQPAPGTEDYAAIAGMSDDTMKTKTGCSWERWVYALDRHGAAEMPHRDIAALVHEKYKVDGWWAQMVTVGYERIKGLRDRGQRRGGTYEASKSRTFAVPVEVLFEACADDTLRRQWLQDEHRRRTARAPKSVRLQMPDDTLVALWLVPKGDGKSVLSVTQSKLTDRAAVERSKEYWATRLEALANLLAA
jgi:hypothetical protein